MRIKLICVGRIKEKYLKDAVSEYTRRMSVFGKLSIVEVQDENDERPASLVKEAGRILKIIRDKEYVFTLEIKGKMSSSEEFAANLKKLDAKGSVDVVFVIGGSKGLHKSVVDRADCHLSFSKMTFPHQLMRVILLEQIYRAYKINHGGKYHK